MINPLYDTLLGRYANSPDPLLHLPNGETLGYADMATQVLRLSGYLRTAGMEKGDRVLFQCPKSPTALAVYLACLHSGVIFVPLNTAYTPDEIAYFLKDATPKILITDPAMAKASAAVAAKSDTLLLTLGADGRGSLTDAAQNVAPVTDPVGCTLDDVACILYTSGTTGRPKGAMLTQGNLLSNARTLTDAWAFTRDDVLLHALPIFHAHGLFVACNVLMTAGGSMIWLPGFSVDAVLEALPRATTMMGVPTFYTRLLDDARFGRDRAGHMRLFTSGSAPLMAETHVRFRQLTGLSILERFGMTETGMNTSNPYHGAREAGSVGMPLDGVALRVTDKDGREVPTGEIGMIEVRGPNVFKGYWQMPEKTADELRPDGFFITGDLGRIDADGYVTIVGRAKDMIITGGYNVYPKEVEQVLDEQPGVKESAVIGVPHPDFGEGVIAVLVPEGNTPPDLAAIRDRLKTKLADYKRPKEYILMDALPRNTMGKVQKKILRTNHAGIFRPLTVP